MIIVTANARSATYTSNDLITSGSIGIPVAFNLSDDFAGLSNVAVFEGSGVSVDVLIVNNTCVVPHEVLASAGGYLRVGVYGRNAGGTIAIPTVWAGTMPILQGVEPSDIDPAAPTPDWTAQVQEQAAEALEIAQGVQAKADAGDFDGEPGISPSITITNITGGHRVTVIDADGTRSFDVLDGTDGDDGRGIASAVLNADYTLTLTYTDGTSYTTPSLRGEPGENGISPVASVSKAGKVATITITDKNGTTTATVSDGEDGTPGVSPTVTVTDITGGHRVTVTDADGAHSFDVMDGEDYVLTQQDKEDIAAEVDVPVQDVQIDGTSILNNGVANVPAASNNSPGVVKVNAEFGTAMRSSPNQNTIMTSKANETAIKAGKHNYVVIVPSNQHSATFYGLAKAAGSDMASSSNPVGTYTDAAKVAIQKMLGVYREWELIADVTVAEDATEIVVDTDLNGQPFELRKLMTIFSAGPSTTGARDSFYQLIKYTNSNGGESSEGMPSLIYPTATSSMLSRTTIEVNDGAPLEAYSVAAASTGNSQNILSMVKSFIAKSITFFRIYQSGSTKSLIPAGANLKIYGIRA